MSSARSHSPFDVIVVGGGCGGIVTAIRAHDLGLRVVVVEAMSAVGGATAFSGGQVWVGANHVMARMGLSDTLADTRTYVRAITDARGLIDEAVSDQWIDSAVVAARYLEDAGAIRWEIIPGYPDYYLEAPGSRLEGRYLTAASIAGKELGEWQGRLLRSPHFPVGVTYSELFELGASSGKDRLRALVTERIQDDILTFGTGIMAHLVRGAASRRFPLLLEHRAVELLTDSGRVTGVRCQTVDGEVDLHGQVVLATSAYDWNPEMVRKYSWLRPSDTGSVAPPGVRGDGIRLAQAAGADITELPADAIPHVPGYRLSTRSDFDAGYRISAEFALPHCFIVDSSGRRFCDDSFYPAIVHAVLDGAASTPSPHQPFFLIWDEEHHRKYGLGPVGPGANYPQGLVTSAQTHRELAARLGIDPGNLASTATSFNRSAHIGVDPEFGRGMNDSVKRFRGDPNHRPNPLLGPVASPPFFGMRMLLVCTAIGAAGVRTGLHGRALAPDGNPVQGLYAIGAAAALTTSGTGYNSGFSLSRAMTFGFLAATDIHARTLGTVSLGDPSRPTA